MSARPARLGLAIVLPALTVIALVAGDDSGEPEPAGPGFPIGFALPKELAVRGEAVPRARVTQSFRAVAPTAEKVRTGLRWADVQANCSAIRAGRFDWTAPDATMRTVVRQGLEQLLTLNAPPPCAAVGNESAFEPERRYRDDFARFARAVVERYGPGGRFFDDHPGLDGECCPVTDIEVWNEPNLSKNWSAHSAVSYGRFFVDVARVIRRAENWGPGLSVVTGGVTGLNGGDWTTNGRSFIRDLYRVPGFEVAADKIGIHTYSPSPQQALENVAIVRRIMDAHDHNAPIEISEHGWSTCPTPGRVLARGKCVERRTQATMLERLVTGLRAVSGELRVSGFLWFTTQDSATPRSVGSCPASPKYFYGFFDHAGRRKPAWSTWQELAGASGDGAVERNSQLRGCREE
jgi:hypothetical protein